VIQCLVNEAAAFGKVFLHRVVTQGNR
jgi:hypothetical protein